MASMLGVNLSVVKAKKRPYFESLSGEVRTRYLEKINLVGGRDPYEIPKIDWCFDRSLWPDIEYFDIVNYLVYTLSHYTQEEMRSFKSLDSYNYFIHGWVHDVSQITTNGLHLLTAKVNHSQRLRETPSRPWVICEPMGKILAAHCNCMAGLAESCSHVGGLLFAIEAGVRIRNSATVTEKKAYWLLPSGVHKVDYKEVNDIDFSSNKTKKAKMDRLIEANENVSPTTARNQPKHVQPPTQIELDSFYQQLNESGSRPIILSLIPPYSDSFVPKTLSEEYPRVFTELLDNQCVGMTRDELINHCRTVAEKITLTQDQAESVEQATRSQSAENMWFSFRSGRVTASRLKRVCHTPLSNPSQSLIKDICYPPKKSFSNDATKWGCDHEKEARKKYGQFMSNAHDNFHIRDSGLVLNPDFPFFGATPDGFVSCDCCGEGIIEIKCPFCKRNEKLMEASDDGRFCLEVSDDGKLKLKEKHQYYYQVQMQIFVCKKDFCDFVVWTKEDLHFERVEPDDDFFAEKCTIATKFFKEALLLELVGKFFSSPSGMPGSTSGKTSTSSATVTSASEATARSPLKTVAVNNSANRSSSQEEVICVCQQPYDENFDSVIGCDNRECPYEWLHYSCIGITRAPKGTWYCPECQPKFKKSSKGRGKLNK